MVDVILVSLPEKFWREVFIEWVQLERERKREREYVCAIDACKEFDCRPGYEQPLGKLDFFG